MITIALDAMGSDSAPRPEVEGAVLASREFSVRVMLIGQPAGLKAELARHSKRGAEIEIVPATEVITMGDAPLQAYRKKKDSSMHVAARLVKSDIAQAVVTAGEYGRGDGHDAIFAGHAAVGGSPCAGGSISNGAGRDERAAGCGRERGFAAHTFGAVRGDGAKIITVRYLGTSGRPRVGLLSIGEEESKGNEELVRETFARLKKTPLNFVGNVEGKEIFAGNVGVIVSRRLHRQCGAERSSESVAQHIGGMC